MERRIAEKDRVLQDLEQRLEMARDIAIKATGPFASPLTVTIDSPLGQATIKGLDLREELSLFRGQCREAESVFQLDMADVEQRVLTYEQRTQRQREAQERHAQNYSMGPDRLRELLEGGGANHGIQGTQTGRIQPGRRWSPTTYQGPGSFDDIWRGVDLASGTDQTALSTYSGAPAADGRPPGPEEDEDAQLQWAIHHPWTGDPGFPFYEGLYWCDGEDRLWYRGNDREWIEAGIVTNERTSDEPDAADVRVARFNHAFIWGSDPVESGPHREISRDPREGQTFSDPEGRTWRFDGQHYSRFEVQYRGSDQYRGYDRNRTDHPSSEDPPQEAPEGTTQQDEEEAPSSPPARRGRIRIGSHARRRASSRLRDPEPDPADDENYTLCL